MYKLQILGSERFLPKEENLLQAVTEPRSPESEAEHLIVFPSFITKVEGRESEIP